MCTSYNVLMVQINTKLNTSTQKFVDYTFLPLLEPDLINQPFTGLPEFLRVQPNNQHRQTNST